MVNLPRSLRVGYGKKATTTLQHTQSRQHYKTTRTEEEQVQIQRHIDSPSPVPLALNKFIRVEDTSQRENGVFALKLADFAINNLLQPNQPIPMAGGLLRIVKLSFIYIYIYI